MEKIARQSRLLNALGALATRTSRLATRKTTLEVAAVIVTSLLAVIAAARFVVAPPVWLAPGLALAALGVALMCANKLKLLEFLPEVLAGDVIVPRPGRLGGDLKLLLPLQFVNGGTAGGVIQWVALRLTVDGDIGRSVLFTPVAEVDMQRFLQAKRRLDEQNTLEPFTAFALEGKRSAAKFVLFDLAEKARGEPLRLRPGRYQFELFLKSSAARSPQLEARFEHTIALKQVEELSNDASVYLIDYQMTLPGVRRQVAGAEWLPRAPGLS